jgi:hypothetical protein
MKLHFFFIILLSSFLSTPAFSRKSAQEKETREHLIQLVNERKERFETFNKAIETKSGIFGNQTKKDIKAANEVLIDLVKTDNRIIFELQRLLDYKSYEKTEQTYSLNTNALKTDQYLTAIDNLNKKNEQLTKKNVDLARQARRSTFWNWVFGLLALGIVLVTTLQKRSIKKELNLPIDLE